MNWRRISKRRFSGGQVHVANRMLQVFSCPGRLAVSFHNPSAAIHEVSSSGQSLVQRRFGNGVRVIPRASSLYSRDICLVQWSGLRGREFLRILQCSCWYITSTNNSKAPASSPFSFSADCKVARCCQHDGIRKVPVLFCADVSWRNQVLSNNCAQSELDFNYVS